MQSVFPQTSLVHTSVTIQLQLQCGGMTARWGRVQTKRLNQPNKAERHNSYCKETKQDCSVVKWHNPVWGCLWCSIFFFSGMWSNKDSMKSFYCHGRHQCCRAPVQDSFFLGLVTWRWTRSSIDCSRIVNLERRAQIHNIRLLTVFVCSFCRRIWWPMHFQVP